MVGLLPSVWVAHLPRRALGASEGLWLVAGLSRVAVLSVETSSSGLRDLGPGSTTVTKKWARHVPPCSLLHTSGTGYLCAKEGDRSVLGELFGLWQLWVKLLLP